MIVPRFEANICVHDRNIYVVGGFTIDDDDDIDDNWDWEVLNLQDNHPEWRLWSPTNLDDICAEFIATSGGQMYILDYDNLYLYDLKQDELKKIVSDEMLTLPYVRAIAAVDNHVFVKARRKMVHYNTETGVLRRVADRNRSHCHYNYEAVGNNRALYMLEKYGGLVKVYDVERNLWTVLEEKKNHRLISNAFLINRRIILNDIGNSEVPRWKCVAKVGNETDDSRRRRDPGPLFNIDRIVVASTLCLFVSAFFWIVY